MICPVPHVCLTVLVADQFRLLDTGCKEGMRRHHLMMQTTSAILLSIRADLGLVDERLLPISQLLPVSGEPIT